MKTILFLLVAWFAYPSTQYGLLEVRKGQDVQVGFVTIHEKTLWVKFDYEYASEYKVTLVDVAPYATTYYVSSDKAKGYVSIEEHRVVIQLFYVDKRLYNRWFKRRNA